MVDTESDSVLVPNTGSIGAMPVLAAGAVIAAAGAVMLMDRKRRRGR